LSITVKKPLFFIKDERYQVTISYDDKTDTYPIKYTLGHFPLQQYLVETDKGKLDVLPFAWDSREKLEGGQRWYHNYNHEEIRHEDRLHWRQPLQNWKGMYADCHSDGLVRNYDADENSFDSQFDNINVGCLSCHGNMSTHAKETKKSDSRADSTSVNHPIGQWVRSIGDKTAHWQGEKRDNTFMDGCFACHSLRSPLTDDIKANTPFLDQFTPQLSAAPNYHADGQIKEEVYVYGSFLQSKMFTAGVNCLDCHDKHTMKLKVESNGLCMQCNSAEVYNVKKHHQHETI
jgi:Zn ribbon nucleic-acid-binding protein